MRVVCVGHGPSLTESQRGAEIDDHDFIVRMKRSKPFLDRPQWFGTKTDAVVCSLALVPAIVEWNAPEYWAFIDSRYSDMTEEQIDEYLKGNWGSLPYRWDKTVCDQWNARYRDLREFVKINDEKEMPRPKFELGEQMEVKPTSDEYGHTHMSAGLHALIYACHFLKPETITLAGYDNVVSGNWTWSLARGPDWNQYPDHRFDIEHEMLPEIEEVFGVKIKPL